MYLVIPILVFWFMSWICFGGVLRATMFATDWNDRLGAPYWEICLVLSAALALYVYRRARRWDLMFEISFAILIAVFTVSSVVSVGVYAGHLRRQVIEDFLPDKVFQNPFLTSLHSAPTDWQFYLHAGAMKDCKPYAFSYRTMSMYELNDDVDHNVLPKQWLKACGREHP